MIKNIIGCLLLCISTWHTANACDACGCSITNQNLGLLPQSNRHFAGIQYQNNTFNSIQRPLSDTQPDIYSEEYYHTVQLWGRVFIGKRWQIFAFLPYRNNLRKQSGASGNISGIGDITVLVNYNLLQTNDSSMNTIRHRLQLGGGVKAPTGRYLGVSELDKAGLPNMQPGTGAWDIPLNLNYTFKYKKTGLNLDAAYNITTPNRYNYKYGNRLNTQLLGFYWLNMKQIAILPQAGIRYEYALHDHDNYDKGWLNRQTGGYILSAVAGIQAYYKSFGVQLSFYKPVAQAYANGDITAIQRADAGILLMF